MGAFISSHRTFSLRLYQSKKLDRRRGLSNPSNRKKRSSMNRPVLKLQIKPETLKQRTRRLNSLQNGGVRNSTHDRDSGDYDHLPPRSSSVPPLSLHTTTALGQERPLSLDSRDSMMVIQFVDNGRHDVTSDEKDEDDYDRLLPAGEHEHLCMCQYRRVNSGDSTGSSTGEHMSTVQIGRNPRILPNFEVGHLRERIFQHIPPNSEVEVECVRGWRRSRSVDAFTSNRVGSDPGRRLIQSTSYLDDERNWSLGEVIMKALSESGLNLFNVENPTYESEKEVDRTWPRLKDKMKKWRQSQQSLHHVDEEVFSESHNVVSMAKNHP